MPTPPVACNRPALRRRTESFCAALYALIAFGTALRAEESVRVAVIHAGEDEGSRRLRAELDAVGLEVIDLRTRPDEDRTAASLAHGARATAAMRVRPTGEVELVIVDDDGIALYSDWLVPRDEPRELFPIRAAEELRAKLVKLQLVDATPRAATEEAPAPAPPPPVTTSPMPAAAEDRTLKPISGHRFAFWAVGGAGGQIGAGGLGVAPTARVGIRIEPTERWGASLFAYLPVASQSVRAFAAAADVRVVTVGALAHYRLTNAHALVDFDVGLGGGAVIASIDGHATALSDVGRSETVAAGSVLASTSLGVEATSWLRLRGEMLGGVAVPRPTIRFNETEVASWGRPFMAATLSAELSLLGESAP